MINLKTSAKSKLFFSYSILFSIALCLCFVPLLLSGRTFVYVSDGFNENLSAFSYFLSKIKGLSFSQYDFSLGTGRASTALFQSFAFCDPLNLIGILFKKSSTFFVYKSLKGILHFFDVFLRLFGYVLMEFADGFAIGDAVFVEVYESLVLLGIELNDILI